MTPTLADMAEPLLFCEPSGADQSRPVGCYAGAGSVKAESAPTLKSTIYRLYYIPDAGAAPDWAVADAVEDMLGQHREAINAFREIGRDDLALAELEEMEILLRYRPSSEKS